MCGSGRQYATGASKIKEKSIVDVKKKVEAKKIQKQPFSNLLRWIGVR